MSLVAIRRALHHLYTLVTLLLIVTGLLLSEPDLRARLVGGYGREILDLHIWVGVGFVAIPVLALLAAARPLGRDLRRRLGPPDGVTWRKVHTVFTLAAGAALGLTGVLLWLEPGMPLAVVDRLAQDRGAHAGDPGAGARVPSVLRRRWLRGRRALNAQASQRPRAVPHWRRMNFCIPWSFLVE
jgi:hypothetical protein